jgi:hypothetical protein
MPGTSPSGFHAGTAVAAAVTLIAGRLRLGLHALLRGAAVLRARLPPPNARARLLWRSDAAIAARGCCSGLSTPRGLRVQWDNQSVRILAAAGVASPGCESRAMSQRDCQQRGTGRRVE